MRHGCDIELRHVSEYILKSCTLFEAGVITSPEGDSASVLMVGPAVGSGSPPEYHLVDSDPNTVWHSKTGEDYVKIAVDLQEAVSTALDSRHKVEIEVGSLQAHAVSLQKKNEVFFFENQGLHSELAELRNEEQKAADLAENLSAQVMEMGKTLSATTSALNDLEKLKQQTVQKLSAAESDLKEAGARVESLCAENTSLQGKIDEAEQNREGEATRLREELAAS